MNPVLLLALAWRVTRKPQVGTTSTSTKARGALRVGAYVLTLALGAGAFVAHEAHASAGRGALSVGRELGTLGADISEGATVRLNDQSFHVAQRTVDESVQAVLDGYQAACEHDPGALADLFHAIPKSGTVKGKAYDLPESFTHGVIRNGDENEGVVVCFVGDPGHPKSALESLGAFAKSQDLGDLGKLRYAYAKKSPSGKTSLTLASTDEHFELAKITTGGEQTGSDGRVPRAEGSRRLLTAEVVGTAHGTRFYETSKSPAQVLAHYDQTLQKAGFRRMIPRAEGQELRAYFAEGLDVFVAVRSENGRTVYAVTEAATQIKNSSVSLEVQK